MKKRSFYILLILFASLPIAPVSAKSDQIVVEKEGNYSWSIAVEEDSLFWIEMDTNRIDGFYTARNGDTAAELKERTELDLTYENHWEWPVDAEMNITIYFENTYEFGDATIEITYGTGIASKFWSLYKLWVVLGFLLLVLLVISAIAGVKGVKSNKNYKDGLKQFSANVASTAESNLSVPKEHLEKMRSQAEFSTVGAPVKRRKLHRKYKHVFFMSHALEDYEPWVKKVAKEIDSWPGCYSWHCERDLKPGDDWLEGIYQGLGAANWFVLFWSNSAKDSNWTNEEIREAKTRSVNSGLPHLTTLNLGVEDWPVLLQRQQGTTIRSEEELNDWLTQLKTQVLGTE